MSGTIGYEELRAATVRQVAQLMAAAAITAPKSGGQLFLAGKPGFMETVITDDPVTLTQLAAWMRARGKAAQGTARNPASRSAPPKRDPFPVQGPEPGPCRRTPVASVSRIDAHAGCNLGFINGGAPC
jgi:hypothetical protein